jgi:cell division protein ZapA
MLADKTAALEDELRQLKLKLAEIDARPVAAREKIEVAVVPPALRETLAELAARAEALAASVEERLAS